MTTAFETVVTTAAALGTGVAGGVYFAFSAIVMPTLRALPASVAVNAMQRINIDAVRLPFMAVFFGGAAASVVVIVSELVSGAVTHSGPTRIVGAGLALAAVGITIVRNVPLNNTLAQLTPDSPGTPEKWRTFDRGWSMANHARAVAAIAATVILVMSLAGARG